MVKNYTQTALAAKKGNQISSLGMGPMKGKVSSPRLRILFWV